MGRQKQGLSISSCPVCMPRYQKPPRTQSDVVLQSKRSRTGNTGGSQETPNRTSSRTKTGMSSLYFLYVHPSNFLLSCLTSHIPHPRISHLSQHCPFGQVCYMNTVIDGVGAYATNDLLAPHPTQPGYWKIFGRADDQIMHSTGEKVCDRSIFQLAIRR